MVCATNRRRNRVKFARRFTSRTDVTIERVLLELHWIRIKAQSEGRYSAAIRCLELQGKYLRMFTDKIEPAPTIDELSDDELVKLILELPESCGLKISQLIQNGRPDNE